LAAAVAIFAFLPARTRTPTVDASKAIATVVIRPDRQSLPDGSAVELNAGAEIAVSYTETQRRVQLVKGEALFEVAKNPRRPFVVTAGDVAVEAVGTAFAVRHLPDGVRVIVTEGRVKVGRVDGGPSEPVYVAAGEDVLLPTQAPMVTAPERLDSVQMANELAWRGKRVEFTDTPCPEAIALFNAQNRLQLRVSDSAIAALRLNGIFWADDPEGFVRLLESGMNVQARRNDNVITLTRR
jgi:transmembrane sensor